MQGTSRHLRTQSLPMEHGMNERQEHIIQAVIAAQNANASAEGREIKD